MPKLAITVLHQAIEQLGQADVTAAAALVVQGLTQGRIQGGSTRQIIPGPTQEQLAHLGKCSPLLLGQDRHEAADEFPPVTQ